MFVEDDIIKQLAKHSNKIVMHIKAVGALECDDPVKEEEVWDFYLNKCNLDVLNILIQEKEVYCYFDTLDQAVGAFEEWFPNQNQLLEEEKHLFIRTFIVSPDESIIVTNESL